MQRKTKVALAAATTASALGAMLLVPGQLAFSADHLDSPTRTDPAVNPNADVGCDIADDYIWHDADVVTIVHTFGGPSATTLPAFYDRNVLQTIDISTSPPATSADVRIRFRFGPGANPGEHGIQVENLPGVNGALIGPVEQILSKDGVRVYAGLRDDPFFFDNPGLRLSRTTGVLQFTSNPSRSAFFARNITAVVIEIPRSRLGAGPIEISSTCARFGGLLS
ncbi:MAG: DUF4331 family protein [Novosphingobium sp.]|nr:DUF4331 family protein [Novosphingobium sp.]